MYREVLQKSRRNPVAIKDVLTARAADIEPKAWQGLRGEVVVTEIKAGSKTAPAMVYFEATSRKPPHSFA